MTAHQRRIAAHFAIEQPRERVASLADYAVETITRLDAQPLILRYEWLGNVGRATHFVGLVSPARELHGAACFGHGPAGTIRNIIGEPALCLERGACVHYAPPNAASYLINRACRLMRTIHGIGRFFAYADPMAGEYGGVYQAAGWAYLGQGLNGVGVRKDREQRRFVLPPGADPNVHANWKSTRELRRDERRVWDEEKQRWRGLSYEEAEALGWRIAYRAGKHVYAVCVGGRPKERAAWRKAMPVKPYPSPQPELKRKAAGERQVFRVAAPPVAQSDLFDAPIV